MNKNIFHTILAFMAVAMICSSCVLHINKSETANGKQTTKTFQVGAFKGIDTQSAVDIIYTVSDTISIKAEGDNGAINLLLITVDEDSILHIVRGVADKYIAASNNSRWLNLTPTNDNGHITLYISGPAISSLNIEGAANFTTESTIVAPAMDIYIAGAAKIEVPAVETGDFKIKTEGASEVEISKLKAQTAKIETEGASNQEIKFDGVKKITLESSGASNSDFELIDCGTAIITLSGAGNADLSGTLHHIEKRISGIGHIDDDDLTIK